MNKAYPVQSSPVRAGIVRRLLRALWRLATDGVYRGNVMLRFVRSGRAFQPCNLTLIDRYPRIFAFVQSQLGKDNELRILSFGCSTGEEAVSLRRYFPRAIIKGIDINPGNITRARKHVRRRPDAALQFEVADSTGAEKVSSYDAIFCMAVLRHGTLGASGVTNCEQLLPFAAFARAVEDFARCLKPGGLLIIRHSNFRFSDAPISKHFEVTLSLPHAPSAKTPIFGPDNWLIPNAVYEDVVFRKRT